MNNQEKYVAELMDQLCLLGCKFSDAFFLLVSRELCYQSRKGLEIKEYLFERPQHRIEAEKNYADVEATCLSYRIDRYGLEGFCSEFLLDNIQTLFVIEILCCLKQLLDENEGDVVRKFPVFSRSHGGYVICESFPDDFGDLQVDISLVPEKGDIFTMCIVKKEG